jgi:hypothetical protein
MSRGHLYLVFGQQYELAATASIRRLQQFSDLPVHVITNIPEQRRRGWDSIDNITFELLEIPDRLNRHIKTQLDMYTPFDETLYTDSDTLIHSKEFMIAFDILETCDIAFPMHTRKESVQRLRTAVYQEAIQMFKPKGDLFVYQGGVCVFKKNEAVRKFFKLWNEYWSCSKFRDMPGLVCAVHNIKGVAIGTLPRSMGFDKSTIIQHYYGWKPPKTDKLPQFIKDAPNEGKRRWEPRKCFR